MCSEYDLESYSESPVCGHIFGCLKPSPPPIFFEALLRFHLPLGSVDSSGCIMANPLSSGVLFQKLGFRCVFSPSRPHVFWSLSGSSTNWHGLIVKAYTFDLSAPLLLLLLPAVSILGAVTWPSISVPLPLRSSLVAEVRKRKTKLPCS